VPSVPREVRESDRPRSKVLAWLRLVRLPSALTAFADVAAGAAVAGIEWSPAAALAAFGSVFLYAGGMIVNDLFELEKDRSLHPERPIPSGQISLGPARLAGGLLLGLGLATALPHGSLAFAIAVLLLTAILLYDGRLGDSFVLGPLLMGTCRCLNFSRGLVLDAHTPVMLEWLFPIAYGLSIVGLTALSLGEDRKLRVSTLILGCALLLLGYLSPAVLRESLDLTPFLISLVIGLVLACSILEPALRRMRYSHTVMRGVFSLPLLGALHGLAFQRYDVVLIGLGTAAAVFVARRAMATRSS
jgi:4-hydroxybenzoate polyprenyltransferase